jgi:hypothetical protein
MATYYKYAERSADSQVNWAEVGKGISDMLTEEIRLREEKKAAYEEAYRQDTNALVNAPQGTWQDGNATVNNFAHDMMAQQLIDYKLLKSGTMNERDYTLRRENYKTGTDTVFDLQKILQAERSVTIDSFLKGDIQALNISNMADVEAYTDFANAKIDIDPYGANINMSIYETKMVDGKEVRVIKKTSPVNVLKGQLLQKVPSFKLDEVVNKDVESLAIDTDFIYDAASTTGAGSITKLIGYGAIAGEYAKKDKDGNLLYPELAAPVGKMKDAVTQTVNKYFSNIYNISSVLTENTGKYSAESYTWDKEEAAKDKTKLLKKLDPKTGLPVLDMDGPHYKEQEQEAREYVEKTILGKLDAKREIVPIQKEQKQYAPEHIGDRGDKIKQAKNFGENLGTLIAGLTDEDVGNSARYTGQFAGRQVIRENGKIIVRNMDGTGESIFDLKGDPKKLASGIISAFGVENEDAALKSAYETIGNKPSNLTTNVTAITSTPPPSSAKFVIPTDAFTQESTEAAAAFQEAFGPDFIVEDLTPSEFDTGNRVKVTAPNGKTRTFNTDVGKDAAGTAKGEAEAWAKLNNITKSAGGSGSSGTVNYGDK